MGEPILPPNGGNNNNPAAAGGVTPPAGSASPGESGSVTPPAGSVSPGESGAVTPPVNPATSVNSPGSLTPVNPATSVNSPGSLTPVNPVPIRSDQQDALDAHIADTNNPHGVTAEMLGAATTAGLADEATARLAGDKYNGVLLPIGNKSAFSIPQDFEVGVTSNYKLTNLEGATLGFPSGGWLEVDMRGCDQDSYNLGKMTIRGFSGLPDLVRYSDGTGILWTDWVDCLVTTDGVIDRVVTFSKPVAFDINPTVESALDFSNPESVMNVDMVQTAGSLDKSYGDTSIHRRIVEYTVPVGVSTIDFNLVTLGIPPRVGGGSSEVKMSCKYYPIGSYHSQCKAWLASIGFSVLGYAYFMSYQTVTREFNAGSPKITFDDLLTEDGTKHSASNTTGVVKIGVNNAHTTPFKILLDIEVTHLPT